jgi:hypothetical protein
MLISIWFKYVARNGVLLLLVLHLAKKARVGGLWCFVYDSHSEGGKQAAVESSATATPSTQHVSVRSSASQWSASKDDKQPATSAHKQAHTHTHTLTHTHTQTTPSALT